MAASKKHKFNGTITPKDYRLRDLFIKWSLLSPKERTLIDDRVEKLEIELYKPLRDALKQWEIIQEKEGAPGIDSGMFTFSCDANLEEGLSRSIYKVDCLMDSITNINSTGYSETRSESNMMELSSDDQRSSDDH